MTCGKHGIVLEDPIGTDPYNTVKVVVLYLSKFIQFFLLKKLQICWNLD